VVNTVGMGSDIIEIGYQVCHNLNSFSAESGASVVFNIAPISPEDRISKIRIYHSNLTNKEYTIPALT